MVYSTVVFSIFFHLGSISRKRIIRRLKKSEFSKVSNNEAKTKWYSTDFFQILPLVALTAENEPLYAYVRGNQQQQKTFDSWLYGCRMVKRYAAPHPNAEHSNGTWIRVNRAEKTTTLYWRTDEKCDNLLSFSFYLTLVHCMHSIWMK